MFETRSTLQWEQRDVTLFMCSAAFFVTMFGRLAISPLVPSITNEFNVSNGLVGLALTGMWLLYGVAQYPSSILADRFGDRFLILVAVAGTPLMALFISFAPAFYVFVIATVLLGVFSGLHYSVAISFLSQLYDDVGTVIGVHNMSVPAAGLITPIVVTWVATRSNWRFGIVSTIPIAVVVFALFAILVGPQEPRRPELAIRDAFSIRDDLGVLFDGQMVLTLTVLVIIYFVWQSLASFLPTFLIEFKNVPPTITSLYFSAYFVVQIVALVLLGNLSDRYGRDRISIVCLVLGAIGIALLVELQSIYGLSIGVFLVAIGVSAMVAQVARIMDVLPEAGYGRSFSVTQSVSVIISSLGSLVSGSMADGFNWAVSFGVLLGLLCFASVLLVFNGAFGTRH